MEFTPRQIAFLLFSSLIRMALTLALRLLIMVLIPRVGLVNITAVKIRRNATFGLDVTL